VQVLVEEKLLLQLDKEGTVKKLEIKGELRVIIHDPDDFKIVVKTNGIKKPSVKCRLHPKINQELWTQDGSLGLKESNKPLPIGPDNSLVIARWKMTSEDDREVPFTVNFWPNNENGRSVVSAEYQIEKSGIVLNDVHIIIPCKSRDAPEVGHVDGTYSFDNKEKALVWSIEEISAAKRKGTLEFSTAEVDVDTFYPINILFTSAQTYSEVEVLGVVDATTSNPVPYTTTVSLSVEKFIVEVE